MTTFKRSSYGGERPVCTNQPIIFPGGFNLDAHNSPLTSGAIIPAGTLAFYDEESRTARILKTARVKDISADKKTIALEKDAFLTPLFVLGDVLAKEKVTNNKDTYTITHVDNNIDSFTISLDREYTSLKIGDVLQEITTMEAPSALVISDTVVKDDGYTAIDISIDSGPGTWYLRRIPPIPSHMIENNLLKTNPNIKFSKSL